MLKIKIKTLSKKDNVDSDELMLHACFQILVDAIEHKNVLTYINKEAHKQFVEEVTFLYNWWLKRDHKYGISNREEDNEMLFRLMKIRCGLWT